SNKDLAYVEFDKDKGFETSSEDTSIAVGVRKNSELTEPINDILSDLSQEDQDKIMKQVITSENQEDMGFFDQMKAIWSEYSSLFLSGIRNTMLIAIFSTIVGFIIGLLVAVIRKIEVNKDKNIIGYLLQRLVNLILTVYVEIFRGTPMMVQSMLIFYGAKQYLGIDMSTMTAALFIVSINTGAYLSEVVRGGINS